MSAQVPEAATVLDALVKAHNALPADFAGRLDALLAEPCKVSGCTLHGAPNGHHHHDAVSRKPSPLACRCARPGSR